MLALAVAMGIGRFAFTPLLPMMLADSVIDLAAASWLASANYLGYLVGALLCTFQPWIWQKLGRSTAVRNTVLVRIGLAATVGLTLGMSLHLPAAWPLLRFAAGVASALVFVYVSGWCLGTLARMGLPAMGAVIYTGPGAGIVLSGLAASGMVALHWQAAAGWLVFGVLAAILTAVLWPTVSPRHELPAAAPAAAAQAGQGAGPGHGGMEIALLSLAYGLAGFGYIITATFLPVIARQALPGSHWLDLFWPIFGLGVIAGALIASRIRTRLDLRWLLAICYVVQAVGVASSLVSPSLAGFAAGSLLLGLPFTAITFFAMQEARRLRPLGASSLMGGLTALYGLGQIVGPPLATGLLHRNPAQGFGLSLEIAAGSLVLGALLYAAMTRLYPVQQPG
ncbi:YbfB/YjiJ family MFS transporter [uncultured Ramlibacter sp.]|uniref:YbfB/YjiJ family MFS transporter n=1 Tax=uncultured Ramlibacter sp. TaxID=260755 RepID=UPI002625D761|nr:YbfB/YjiJ family MFS transporter [uncultured Ramlibacter sp.]